jgi:hypothetical protein
MIVEAMPIVGRSLNSIWPRPSMRRRPAHAGGAARATVVVRLLVAVAPSIDAASQPLCRHSRESGMRFSTWNACHPWVLRASEAKWIPAFAGMTSVGTD